MFSWLLFRHSGSALSDRFFSAYSLFPRPGVSAVSLWGATGLVVKTGVSLPDELYERLRRLAEAMGYSSVSRAIRDAVELFIAFNSWWGSRGVVKGVLVLVVDEARVGSVSGALLSGYGCVRSFMVERLGAPGLAAVFVFVEGGAGEVKGLYKELTRLRGVYTVQPVLLPVGAVGEG